MTHRTTRGVIALIWILCLPIHALWWGYVATRLWFWYVVPLGLPAIGLWHAVGLGVTAKYIGSRYVEDDTKNDEQTGSEFFASLLERVYVYPTSALVVGWAVQRWCM